MPGAKPGQHADPHGWNSLDNDVKTQQGYLAFWERRGFLIIDALEWRTEEGGNRITLRGRLHFRGGYSLAVDKVLAVRVTRGRREVQTVCYAYQALRVLPDGQVRKRFRYDNDHQYSREGHPDAHHKHVRDRDGKEQVVWVGRENWPTLHKVIDELYELALQLNDTLWQSVREEQAPRGRGARQPPGASMAAGNACCPDHV